MYFKHDSWDTFYKDPFGALPMGSYATFRVKSSEVENISLHTRFRDSENTYPMKRINKDIYEVTIQMPSTTGLLWYEFTFDYFGQTYTYRTGPDGLGGEGQVDLFGNVPYQITVYDPARKVPDWYKEGVIYQIFPDRFYKGDYEGTYFPKSVLHGNWSDKPHYFRGPDGSIEYWDFYGGNLAGITEKLDYIKDLGATILYLNPIFLAVSNHKYDTADYHRIAPEFGELSDFKKLCEEAKKRGMHVILDGVFNHTGDDSVYFNRYGRFSPGGAYNDENSPFVKWYNFTDYPNVYESWWGIPSMPSMDKNNSSYQHFVYAGDNSVIRKWLRLGADGWRLDVADELTDEFIVGIKSAMQLEKPDSVLIGEVWEDASNKVAYGSLRNYFSGKELDSVMNYPFRTALLEFYRWEKNSSQTMRALVSLYDHYPHENFYSNMNLLDSHDRKRILTALGDLRPDEGLSEAEREAFELSEEALELAKKRLLAATIFQIAFPGVPTIYYGDETGMQGLEDPYNRGPMNWDDIDEEIFEHYKSVLDYRNNSDVLKKGDFTPLWTEDDVLAYKRSYKDQSVLVLINRSPYANTTLDLSEHGTFGWDVLSGQLFDLSETTLDPLEGRIIEIEEKGDQDG